MKNKRIAIKQHDITDCGAACLLSVSIYYGFEIPLSRIRQYASTDKKGTNILGMIEAAKKLGFSARGVKGAYDTLFQIPLPAIAHTVKEGNIHHFVVIYEVTPKYVSIMDPAEGKIQKIPHTQFKKLFTGILIIMMPDEGFRPDNQKVSLSARLWFLIRPHRFVLLQATAGAAIYTLIGLTTAIYVQLIVDHVLVDSNKILLNLLGIVMLVLLLLQIAIGTTKSVFTLKTGQLIDARLILGYYKHLLTLPQRFFDTMRVGEITSRIGDAVKIRAFINDAAINIMVNIFIVLFSFGLMFTYYWKLGLLMLLVIPSYGLIYYVTNHLNKKTQRKLMEDGADLESQLVESLNAISTIKQFGLEAHANTKTEIKFIQLLKTVYRSGLNALFSQNSSHFTSRLFTIILLWAGSGFVLSGMITPGELLSFYAIIGYFTGPVTELVGMNRVIQDATIAADRLFEIMDLDKEEEKKKIILKPDMTGDIRFENVHFRYGSRMEVFTGLNLFIPKGKITAFVGESGSGKTTIMNIIQKMYPLEKGSVYLGSLNLQHIQSQSLRKVIASVPQKIDLFSGNVIENIAPGVYQPDMNTVLDICKQLGILSFIESLPNGFETPLGENGATLSGGQKQRIAIARALYKSPEILLLDEATSSLDSASEEYVQKTIQLLRNKGKTVIIIAHRLSTVYRADKVCLLINGNLAEEGTHQQLLSNGKQYRYLWDNQIVS